MYRFACLAVLLLLPTPSAAATDLIVNGNFDMVKFPPWVESGVWDGTHDVNNQIGSSGSMRIDNTFQSTILLGRQCVNIQPISYRLSLWLLAVPQGASGSAYASVGWFDGLDCSGNFVGTPSSTPSNSGVGSWELLTADLSPPTGAVSARIQLVNAHDSSPSGTFTSYFDAVSFVPEPSLSVLTAAALLALAAIARLRQAG